MRTLDPIFQAALDSGNFEFYFQVEIAVDDGMIWESVNCKTYTLSALEFNFTVFYETLFEEATIAAFARIKRGTIINGVTYEIQSGTYYVTNSTIGINEVKYTAKFFPETRVDIAGDGTYREVITAFCALFGKTPVFLRSELAYWDYQYLPDGKQLLLNNANNFFSQLQQKYFIFAAALDNDEVAFFYAPYIFKSPFPADTVYSVSCFNFGTSFNSLGRQLIWKDENGTTHQNGDTSLPYHNAGFIQSTGATPTYWTNYGSYCLTQNTFDIVANWKYTGGDCYKIYFNGTPLPNPLRCEIIETLDTSKSPALRMTLKSLVWFSNTEGGAMPSTIERVANYTPLNTSYFNRILSSHENNVQAAFDELDDAAALDADLTAHIESPQASAHGSGFYLRSQSTISRSTRTVTVAPVSGTFDVYIAGKKFSLSSLSTTFPTTANRLNYIYIDTDGALQNSTTAWSITGDAAPAATAYWNGSTARLCDERHASSRNKDWHLWAHDTIGTRYESGLSCSFTTSSCSLGAGYLHDEDIEITVAAQTACIIWYRSGSYMTFDDAASSIAAKVISGALKYDSAGSLASVASANYVTNWLYGTNDTANGFYLIVGQAEHGNLTAARAAALPTLPNIPGPEMKLLYQVIWRNVAGTPTFVESTDFRASSALPAGGTSGVAAVTASSPLSSSGGLTPDISISAASGSAAGSMSAADKTKLDYLTLSAAALSLTGGGTISLGGYTLTIPATGTAALLGTVNTFTVNQIAPSLSVGSTNHNVKDAAAASVAGPPGGVGNGSWLTLGAIRGLALLFNETDDTFCLALLNAGATGTIVASRGGTWVLSAPPGGADGKIYLWVFGANWIMQNQINATKTFSAMFLTR